MIKTFKSSDLRSKFAVSSINGSESIVTLHAYIVMMSPVSAVLMPKSFAMSLKSGTGTNSVVLNIKAAKASAITLI